MQSATHSSDRFVDARMAMVEEQLRSRGIRDSRVLQAMESVPRHEFVSEALQSEAYEDRPLPIGKNQFMSQPYMVAWMIESLALKQESRVLEVGTGSGYAAAVLSCLCQKVYTIERHGELAGRAGEILERLGFANVKVAEGDGSLGWPTEAPFEGIVVAAGSPQIPVPLCAQLATGARLVVPIGDVLDEQVLTLIQRTPNGLTRNILGDVRFVPLIGSEGWSET